MFLIQMSSLQIQCASLFFVYAIFSANVGTLAVYLLIDHHALFTLFFFSLVLQNEAGLWGPLCISHIIIKHIYKFFIKEPTAFRHKDAQHRQQSRRRDCSPMVLQVSSQVCQHATEIRAPLDWRLCSPAALSHLVFHTRPSCPLLLTPQTLWSLLMFVLHCREVLRTIARAGEREGKGGLGENIPSLCFSLCGVLPCGSEALCWEFDSLTLECLNEFQRVGVCTGTRETVSVSLFLTSKSPQVAWDMTLFQVLE